MTKLKVYLKGFDRPYAVFGHKLFEDERFFVMEIEGRKLRILWENILYIESFEPLDDLVEQPVSQSKIPQPQLPLAPRPQVSQELLAKKLDEATAKFYRPNIEEAGQQGQPPTAPATIPITVNFTGHQSKTLTLNVPPETMSSSKFSAALSKEIFSAPEVQALTGSFVIQGQPVIKGNNVFISTVSPNDDPMKEAKSRLDATQTLLNKMAGATKAGQFKPPSLGFDVGLSMPGSPFTSPISLQDNDEGE